MAKRGDNIHRRKDGRWEGRIKTGNYENGKTKYVSLYAPSYRAIRQKMDDYKSGSALPAKQRQNITLGDLLSLWYRHEEPLRKSATSFKYQRLIDKHILPEIGSIKVVEITSGLIDEFCNNKMKNGRLDGGGKLATSYVKTILLIIRNALQYGADEGLCPEVRLNSIKVTKEVQNRRIFSREEQKRLREYLEKDTDPTKLGILLSLYTGSRIGELCALRWNDIDLKDNIIHIRHTVSRIPCESGEENRISRLVIDTPKTASSYRDIPIPSVLLPVLRSQKKGKTEEYLLSGDTRFLSPRTFEYRYQKILSDCRIDRAGFHTLRHTFATRCIETGVDAKTLCELLGHSNVSITLNTYVHSSMELKRKQLEKSTRALSLSW